MRIDFVLDSPAFRPHAIATLPDHHPMSNRIPLPSRRAQHVSSPSGRTGPRLAGRTVLVGVLLALSATPAFAVVETDGASKGSLGRPTDEGFTRDSLAELGRSPEPARPKGPIAASTRIRHSRLDGKDFSPHHADGRDSLARTDGKDFVPGQARRHHGGADAQLAAKSSPKHRNIVQSFIYGWNGWVLHTFHTHIGTVMLSKIGART